MEFGDKDNILDEIYEKQVLCSNSLHIFSLKRCLHHWMPCYKRTKLYFLVFFLSRNFVSPQGTRQREMFVKFCQNERGWVLIPKPYIQCYAIGWEQLENWQFSRGYNFLTNCLISILKTPTCPYSYSSSVIFCLELVNTWS